MIVRRFLAMLAVSILCIGCGEKERDPQVQVSPTKEPAPSIEPTDSGGPVVSIAGQPALEAGVVIPPNTSGITPMDVVSGVPAPSKKPSSSADDQSEPNAPTEESSVSVNPTIPPGLPIPDFSGIVGHSNYRVESVTMGTAKPGEGPVGPDGKVIDPSTLVPPGGLGGPVGPDGKVVDPNDPNHLGPSPRGSHEPENLPQLPSSRGKRLDPSEAPQFPPASQKESESQ